MKTTWHMFKHNTAHLRNCNRLHDSRGCWLKYLLTSCTRVTAIGNWTLYNDCNAFYIVSPGGWIAETVYASHKARIALRRYAIGRPVCTA